jgi:hypothetical protein
MSRKFDSDESEGESTSGNQTPNSAAVRNINELLVRALAEAANPGVGDEEPEVLEAPPHTSGHTQNESKRSNDAVDEPQQSKQRKSESTEPDPKVLEEQRIKAENDARMEAEERRAADLQLNMMSDHAEHSSVRVMRERAKYIPLRLTYEERKSLRLVNATINVSDYTTAVDIPFKNKARRHHVQLQHTVAFMSGLLAATNYDIGQGVLQDRNFTPFEDDIKTMLEIARRYKITNPEKMRSEYGKLVFLMQDAVSEAIQPLLGVNIHRPVKTVYAVLHEKGGLDLLDDPQIVHATTEILADKNKPRSIIQAEIRRKEKAADYLVKRYASRRLSADDIRMCMYSISDNNSFLNSNRKPVVDCIELLKEYFSPANVEPGYSLGIDEGVAGARLSHTHELQYNYVLQSLALWAAILEDMFRLWYLAEQDLLSATQPYELKNTGQGLQRVQQSPRVFKAMHEILAHTKQTLGGWVGSSVIHLGDHNVPNTLVFIDKYTQVSRILGPLITTLHNLEAACAESEGLTRYLQAYGGIEKAKKDILQDFFTHAFDGSGGDNFFDAGSCIDGRLTSAWNWCSQLSTKPYYPLFRLTGFLSFDGQFEK